MSQDQLPMSDTELLEAAVRHFGSKSALANALGVNRVGVSHWEARCLPSDRRRQIERLLEVAAVVSDCEPASSFGFPSCFNTQAQFDGWVKLSIAAKENVSVCADCTHAYRAEMKDAGRCEPARAKTVFMPIRR